MKLTNTKLILIFAVIFNMISCKKFEKVNLKDAWNPDLALPLAHSVFSVYDVFAKSDTTDLVVSNQTTGEISLVYNKVIASLTADKLFGNFDFNEQFSYDVAELSLVPQTNYAGVINSFRTEVLNFETENGEELDHVNFKSGFFNIHMETILKQDINVTMTFPKLKNGNTPIVRDFILEYAGVIPNETDVQIDLTNLNGNFTIDGTQHNKLEVDIQVTVIGDGTQDITGTEVFNSNFSSQDLLFKNMDGYFGQTSILQETDSVLIKVFKNTDQEGNFVLANPSINFTIDNSFGIPIDLHLSNLQTIQTFDGGGHLPLEGFPTPIPIATPTEVGEVITTSLELNSQNTTNIESIISPTPKYFYYEANALPNPQGKTGTLNFVDETSVLEIKAEVDMPLEGYAYGFYVQDTVDFSLDQDISKIESLIFRMITDNGFPINFNTQITAIDKKGKKVFDFFEENVNLVEGADVDNNGKVTVPTRKISDIEFTKEQLEKIEEIDKLIIRGEITTTGINNNNVNNSTVVKFYDFYKLAIKLSINLILK